MKLLYSILLLLLFANSSFSQEAKGEKIVSFLILEESPIYPGCKGSRKEIKTCFSKEIQNLFSNNFNKDLPNQLYLAGGKYRVYIGFKVNHNGNVVDVKVRRVPNKKIKEEVLRVMSLFPKVIPGKQRGEVIGVKYSIPFTINVVETKKQKRAREKRERLQRLNNY